jgi:hypothetical protein
MSFLPELEILPIKSIDFSPLIFASRAITIVTHSHSIAGEEEGEILQKICLMGTESFFRARGHDGI